MASLPDLEITALSVTSPLQAGVPYTLSATVRNNGAVDTGRFFVDFYVSTDGTVSSDDVVFAFCDYSGVATAASEPCSFTVTGSFGPEGPVSAGSYRVIGVVDARGDVGESNETNSTFVTEPITVN